VDLHGEQGENLNQHGKTEFETSDLPERNENTVLELLNSIKQDGKYMLTENQIKKIKEYHWGSKDKNIDNNCLTLASSAATEAAKMEHTNAKLLRRDQGMLGEAWKEYPSLPSEEKQKSGIESREAAIKNMTDYAYQMITQDYPVLVGVNYKASNINEGVTDHFLVIIGVEVENGKVSKLIGIDNATSPAWEVNFRVRLAGDASAIEKKPISPALKDIDDIKYDITQVRLWEGQLPPDTTRKGSYFKGGYTK
jgi:hypothetical protein